MHILLDLPDDVVKELKAIAKRNKDVRPQLTPEDFKRVVRTAESEGTAAGNKLARACYRKYKAKTPTSVTGLVRLFLQVGLEHYREKQKSAAAAASKPSPPVGNSNNGHQPKQQTFRQL